MIRAAGANGDASLAVAVVWDEAQRREANRRKRNYWYAYIWEILDRLGVTACPLARSLLCRPGRLKRFGSIILGGRPFDSVPAGAAESLAAWVRGGGTLIVLAQEGLDSLLGIKPGRRIPQPRDEFAINGYLQLGPAQLTRGIRSPLLPKQKLIVISPVRPAVPERSREIARFFRAGGLDREDGARSRDTGLAAVTARRVGRGWAFYIGFDLARTVWAIQQGRPVDRDYDGDGYLRFGDAMVIGKNSPEVPYAEELALLLRNMLARKPVPMVDPLPPTGGAASDALFYFGGDDECEPGVQVPASEFMRSRALPYHINLMPLRGRFAISRQEFRRIRANGHELSLHYNFMDDFAHPGPFAKKDVLKQSQLYRRAFGKRPVCTVNHWCRWTGWAEPARWMLAAGGKADNSRIQWPLVELNPVNTLGFAFGTPFPYFFRDDWRGGNARIPFLQEPIVGYEIGYLGEKVDSRILRRAVDLAARYNMTVNMFYHPTYISHNPACRRAVDELLRCLRAKKVRAAFMGNDELARWWHQRSRARIREAHLRENAVCFVARCQYAGGFAVRVPLGNREPERCLVDGRPLRFSIERRFGQNWALLPLGPGQHEVVLQFAPPGSKGRALARRNHPRIVP